MEIGEKKQIKQWKKKVRQSVRVNKFLVPKNTLFYAFSDQTEQFTEEEVLLPLCLRVKLKGVEILEYPYFDPRENYTFDGDKVFAELPTYTLKPVILATWVLKTRSPKKKKEPMLDSGKKD